MEMNGLHATCSFNMYRHQQHSLELSLFQPQQHLWPSLSKLDISGRYVSTFSTKLLPSAETHINCLSNPAKITSSKQALVQIKGGFFLITAVSSRFFFLQNLQNVIKKSVFWNTPTQLQGLAFCHAVIAQTHRGSRRSWAHLPDSAGNDLNMVNLIESSYIFTIPRRNMTILDT